ncbi:MAG: enoyl-CoA hydratase/isomerase family protein [Pseudomonadota bacterium]
MTVTLSRINHVATVTFAAPPANHVSIELLRDLANTFATIDADATLRASVLRSEGRIFCAGADLDPAASDTPADRDFTTALYEQAIRLFENTKPVVAAVQGAAVGAGLGLALACDFRVATPEARFCANFVQLGFHAGFGISATLPRVIGAQRAHLMLLTARRIGGEQAGHWGLADVVVPLGEIDRVAHDLAAELAANAPLAVQETRRTNRAGLADLIRATTAHEGARQAELRDTADFCEGIAAVAERRPGRFTGR